MPKWRQCVRFNRGNSSLPHVDIVSNLSKLDQIPNASCVLIYASHVLEHFPRHETKSVLIEWVKKLMPGGILRLSVPDFEQLIKIYQKYKDIGLIHGPLFGRSDYDLNRRHVVFDKAGLSAILAEIGMKDIRLWNWRDTEHSSIDDYSQAYIPHMQKTTGIPVSLNIESTWRGE